MKIGIASDHRGYLKKQILTDYLKKIGYTIIDYGTNTKESVDYPDFAFKVGTDITAEKIDCGILICGSGIGMSIACNKVKGIRCARICNKKDAMLAAFHNNANAIALGSNLSNYKLKSITKKYLETAFSNEKRHIIRNEKIDTYEH